MSHKYQKRKRFTTRGFTLVELMVVVAIIGLMAAMAIPDYLSFTTKTRQSEAKTNLAGIFTAEMTYFTESGKFSGIFTLIPWSPTGIPKYTYDIGSAGLPGGLLGLIPPSGSPDSSDVPGASISGFTALAYGNMDNDPTIDTWEINNDKQLKNTKDDSRQ